MHFPQAITSSWDTFQLMGLLDSFRRPVPVRYPDKGV